MAEVEPLAGHTASWRKATLPDGTVGAWVTVDGVERWIGFYKDDLRAQFAAENMVLAVQAGWAGSP